MDLIEEFLLERAIAENLERKVHACLLRTHEHLDRSRVSFDVAQVANGDDGKQCRRLTDRSTCH